MADYEFEGSGSFELLGKADHSISYLVETTFDVGDIVYIRAKARVGKIEAVKIKRINLIDRLNFNYQDLTNRIWFERELCTEDEATEIRTAFLHTRHARYVAALKNQS